MLLVVTRRGANKFSVTLVTILLPNCMAVLRASFHNVAMIQQASQLTEGFTETREDARMAENIRETPDFLGIEVQCAWKVGETW